MKNETIYLLETRANLSLEFDLGGKGFSPSAELVLVGYAPTYRARGDGSKAKPVKEYTTHTQRIKLSLKTVAELEKSIGLVRQQMEQFEKMAEFVNGCMQKAPPDVGLFAQEEEPPKPPAPRPQPPAPKPGEPVRIQEGQIPRYPDPPPPPPDRTIREGEEPVPPRPELP